MMILLSFNLLQCHAKERAKSGEMGFPFDGYQLVMEEEEDNIERVTRIFFEFWFLISPTLQEYNFGLLLLLMNMEDKKVIDEDYDVEVVVGVLLLKLRSRWL